jgi:transcriptional regulator with XRE-family HTH domain
MRERTPFGERLYKARTHAKLSQPQLSRLAGVSQGNIGELEWKGDGSMAVVRLAMACGVRPEWLAEGDGEMIDRRVSQEFAHLAAAIETLSPKWKDWVLMTLREAVKLAREADSGSSVTTNNERPQSSSSKGKKAA